MSKWNSEVVASFTGPNAGLIKLDLDSTSTPECTASAIAGCNDWNNPSEYAYGISLSLYEEDRTQTTTQIINGIEINKPLILGEPVADVFGILVRENWSIMAVADGVSWGRKARLAARCAVHAVMEHLSSSLGQVDLEPNSHTISRLLLESVTIKAQDLIIKHHATLTTLSAAVVCEMEKPGEWGLFVVAVGDSPVYVYCPHTKSVIEVTVGCHSHNGIRDVRMAGGTLGPSMGSQADLANLTIAYMPVYPGDIVFCTSDGISDNFSSEILKTTMPTSKNCPCDCTRLKPCCENIVRMTEVLSKHQDLLSHHLSAQTVSACLVNHAVEVTEAKRTLRSHCIEKGIDIRKRKSQDPEFATQVNNTPGKLDHATVVAYQVGHHHN